MKALVFTVLAFLLSTACPASVRVGADRLFDAQFRQLLEGKRVGVLAHAASRLADGTHIVDALHKSFNVRAIFAPEHGFRGGEDEPVGDSHDPATGLPVFSLYGPRRAPSNWELSLIDVMVIDLQDVGVRFYTFPATMAWTIEACARAHKPVIVLDRPEVLGRFAEGAMLELQWAGGITSFFPTTTIHGLTLGELAKYYNTQLHFGASVTVIPAEGWTHEMTWADTGLEWRPPSPALPTSVQALLYGVFGPFECLNLAVGRSLDNHDAFHVFGAPWVTPAQQAAALNRLQAANLPGLKFTAAEWTPDRREYEGQLCRGFHVEITDERAITPFRSMVTVLEAMQKSWPGLSEAGVDRSIGARWVRRSIIRNESVDTIVGRAHWLAEKFVTDRKQALLYK